MAAARTVLAALLIAPLVTACAAASGATNPNLGPVTRTPVCAEPGVGLARRYLEDLAAIGGRPAFTAKETQARDYITSALEGCGYTVSTQPFDTRRGHSANVIAVRPGAEPDSPELIIGAHYDSVDASDGGADGVDDNASGVAVLLELAAQLRDTPTHYAIKFIAFGAEEVGDMEGSKAFVARYVSPELRNCGPVCVDTQDGAGVRVLAMINLDALAVGDIAYVHGNTRYGPGSLMDWVTKAGSKGLGLDNDGDGLEPSERVDTTVLQDDLWEDSDYFNFAEVGIPFLYLEATNWRLGDEDGFTQVDPRYGDEGAIYHTEFDNLAYLDRTFPGRIDARLAVFGDLLERIATQYREP